MLWLLPVMMALPGDCAIAVLDFQNGAAAPETAKVTADALAIELGARTGCRIVTAADIRSMADFESIRQNLGCEADSCLAELGGALGVERVVTGDIAVLDERSVVINARIAEVKSATVVGRANVTAGRSAAETRAASPRVARALLGEAEPEDSPSTAVFVVGGVGVGVAALSGVVFGVAESTLATPTSLAADKDAALVASRVGGVGVVAGVLAVGVAGVLFAVGGAP